MTLVTSEPVKAIRKRGVGRWCLRQINQQNYPAAMSALVDAVIVVPIVCVLALIDYWDASTVLLYVPTPDLSGKSFGEIVRILVISNEENVFDQVYGGLIVSWLYSFFAYGWMIRQRKAGRFAPELPQSARWVWPGFWRLGVVEPVRAGLGQRSRATGRQRAPESQPGGADRGVAAARQHVDALRPDQPRRQP